MENLYYNDKIEEVIVRKQRYIAVALRGLVLFPGQSLHFDAVRDKSMLALNRAAEENQDVAALAADYKGVFFILQNLHYLRHETFIPTKAALLQLLGGKDQAVLQRSVALNSGAACDFSESFELLFTWCQETLQAV